MNFAKRFVKQFALSILAVLSCFERVIFKGHLPFGDEAHLNAFVDRVLKMRRKDFLPGWNDIRNPWSNMPADWPNSTAGPTRIAQDASPRRDSSKT